MLRTRGKLSILLVTAVTASLTFGGQTAALAGPGGGGGGGSGGGGGMADTGSLYSDLVVALRDEDGTPMLKEYLVPETEEAEETIEYCVQPASYAAVPGLTATVNPLDGRNVWVIPLQGEWIENPVDPLPVAEIEPCDPQPQYAMFVAEAELERLNLTRTSEDVLARKISDVEEKLVSAGEVSLDPAGRLATDGSALDAAPEYAAIYQSLMTTGAVPGLDFADIPYDAFQLGAVAIGTAAGKYVPITVDTVQYYNRSVGFTSLDPLPSWGTIDFIRSVDPDPATPMAIDVLPGGENFVDYGDFTYNRADTFIGATTWLDVAAMTWNVDRVLDVVPWTNLEATGDLTEDEVNGRTLTGVTAYAQMADDVRSAIVYLHENEVVLPGFYMDPVLVDTYDEQMDSITYPAVQLAAPEVAFQTLQFVATGSLYNPWGGTLIDEARVRVVVDAPAALDVGDVTVSSGGVEVPFAVTGEDLTGWWGPDTGFEMDKGYRVTTDFDVTVAGDAPSGDYTVSLELVDIDDTTAVLASDSSVVDVQPAALAVLWGGDLPVLGTQGTYYPLPVRVYSPTAQEGTLTFTLTGPGDDPTTDLVEQLAVGDAKIYASNGVDMVAMTMSLGDDVLTGTWPASLGAGYNDLTWYLMVNEGAPVGQYGLDVAIEGGTDLAEAAYVSFAAPPTHGNEPPDTGEDTTTPAVVMITIDAVTADSATFSFTANEADVTFQTLLAVDGVKGEWEDATTGTKTYTGLEPADYVFYVKGTDADGNVATYVKKFTIPEPDVVTPPTTPPTTPTPEPGVVTPPVKGKPTTEVVTGPRNNGWVVDDEVSFTVDSDADDATYEVSLNGRRWIEHATDTVTVEGLRPGLNRIRVRARVQGDVDATAVRRRVWVPYGVHKLTRTDGWKLMHNENAFLDTFAKGHKGQYMTRFAKVKRIALVVTTTRSSGKVHVYLGSRRITKKAISLRSSKTQRSRLVMVRQFAKAQRGQVRVVAVGGGAVRVEGIGLAR